MILDELKKIFLINLRNVVYYYVQTPVLWIWLNNIHMGMNR